MTNVAGFLDEPGNAVTRQRTGARRRGVDARHVVQYARPQRDSLERLAVPAQRDFIRRAAGDELVNHVRQALARQQLEVVESQRRQGRYFTPSRRFVT